MKWLSRTGIFPVLFFLFAAPLGAQSLVRSWLHWRTVETGRFVFHYPADLEEWTRALASHADAVDSTVVRIVGFAPHAKTQVVVDDPYSTPNGSAWPFIDHPVINVWATPPDPRLDIGEYHDWGATLLAHEFTHIAHLARPSRNTALRRLWALAPVDLGPITLNAPRWVIEGFATYAEGRATGSGRPHGSWRSAYLRQWAIEGQLPRYDQLNGFGSFEGGEFAYLAGSAFLEWLADRHGDSSLVDVWRRMTAKQPRGFDEAFAGVYGESARTLYGRFTAELTTKAVTIEKTLRTAFPSDTGEIVQRLAWDTGDPAVSRDGRRIAISLASPTQPARIVIWSTAPEPDTLRARRDSILRARDPEDVPARSIYPPPKRPLAMLRVTTGAPYESPRFLSDGRVLVSRNVRAGDGSYRPDLYLWDPQRRTVRRVTRHASVRLGDPNPTGREAVAVQCLHGWCDVVLVDLTNGSVTPFLRGSADRSYYRPRFSPDGNRIAVSVNANGRWRVIVVDRTTLAERDLPFAGNAYDALWLTGTLVVATSDADGIPNLQFVNLNGGSPGRLTAVTGAAVAAERVARDSSIWFLSLHSRGYDLRRVVALPRSDSVRVALDPGLAPASTAVPVSVAAFPANPVSPPRPFDLGARLVRWLPWPQVDADGYSAVVALSSTDVIGRSEIVGKVGIGDRAEWRGVSAEATWRGFRPFVRLSVFDVAQSPSGSRSPVPDARALDLRLRGAFATIDGSSAFESWSARYRIAGGANRLRDGGSRTFAVGDVALAWSQRFGTSGLYEAASSNIAAGRAAGSSFYRTVSSAGLGTFGFLPVPVSLTGSYAQTSRDAPVVERLVLGGSLPTLTDRLVVTQRLAMPVLPTGTAVGTSALTYKVSVNTQPLALYYWSGSATDVGTRFSAWHRVIGVEALTAVAPIPVAGVPAARISFGAGESLDAPFRKQVRGYIGVVINP